MELDPQLGEFNYKKVWSIWCFNSVNTSFGAFETEFLVVQLRGVIALGPKMSYYLTLRKQIHHELHICLPCSNKCMYILQISLKCSLYLSSTANTEFFSIHCSINIFLATTMQVRQNLHCFLQHMSTFKCKKQAWSGAVCIYTYVKNCPRKLPLKWGIKHFIMSSNNEIIEFYL